MNRRDSSLIHDNRHLALSALNQEKTAQLGVQNKRRRARWDDDYLLQVLAGSNGIPLRA